MFNRLLGTAFPLTAKTPFFAFLNRTVYPDDGWRVRFRLDALRKFLLPFVLMPCQVYDPVEEFTRMGLPGYNFRLSNANATYQLCDTYPGYIQTTETGVN